MGRRAHGGVPRQPAFVGMADESHLTVRTGQRGRPFDRVVSVAHVGVVVAEVVAVGAVAAAHVLGDEDVPACRPIFSRGMQNACVGRALHHHAERSLADRPRDVAHETRTVAGFHKDGGVFGDGVLRIGNGAWPERVVFLDHERRGAPHETHPSAGRLPSGEHHSGECVAVPSALERLVAAAAEHERVAFDSDVRDRKHALTGAAANRSDETGVGAGEVREAHSAPPLETAVGGGAERDVGVPFAGEGAGVPDGCAG